jgi:hypothetical protein
LLAVVVAEQEGEAGQVGAQPGEVVARGADEAAESGGELGVVGAAEPLADEGEHLGEFGGVGEIEVHLGSWHRVLLG